MAPHFRLPGSKCQNALLKSLHNIFSNIIFTNVYEDVYFLCSMHGTNIQYLMIFKRLEIFVSIIIIIMILLMIDSVRRNDSKISVTYKNIYLCIPHILLFFYNYLNSFIHQIYFSFFILTPLECTEHYPFFNSIKINLFV